MLATIILAPLVGAAILGLFGKRMGERAIAVIACSTVAVSAIISFYAFFGRLLALPEEGRRIHEHLFTWINVGSFRADFSLLLDPLSGIYVVFITFVAFWIHVFATGYMHGDSGYWRFFAYLNLFMFSMLTLVLADNFLLMFVGWEGVGLCSYLLIGYYYTRGYASDAAKKAFIVNRIGDFGFALGVMLLFLKSGSIFYFTNPATGVRGAFDWAMTQAVEPLGASMIFAGGLTTVALLLFVGATGKSAQIPLYVWLPDAMAGPTPVSALIHAATMVTAGVYMVARASSIFTHAPTAMLIVAVIGAATALFAATIGLAQWDIKKVLAYSTISQLGYMFLACGVGAFSAAIFHVFTHAFFKALLFLGSGSVIVGMHHEQDMRRMGGLKRFMPVTFATMLVGWLAISGVPIFSGFFSKDEILYRSFVTDGLPEPWGKILWGIGALTALLTAVYMTRLMVLTFWGKERFSDHAAAQAHAHARSGHADESHQSVTPPGVGPDEHEHHSGPPRESPLAMTLPLIVLAAGAALVGLLGVPEGLSGGVIPNYFEHVLEPSIARQPGAGHAQYDLSATDRMADYLAPAATHAGGDHTVEIVLTVVSVILALLGIFGGWVWFNRKPLWQPPRLLEEKYYVDEAYDAAIVHPIKAGSTNILWKIIDIRLIDGAVNAAGSTTRLLGRGMSYLQSGHARSYVAVVVFGALLLIGYFVIR